MERPLEELVFRLSRLPGIGVKTARRLSYFLLESDQGEVEKLAKAILEAKEKIRECEICFDYTDEEICPICKSAHRDRHTICVVEEPKDVQVMEQTAKYNGLYHVLHGVIVPERGVLPPDLRIKELFERLKKEEIRELILATNPTKDGDTTARYIARMLKDVDIKITRIAHGIPVGGDLEYYDELTVATAMQHRTEFRDG
ncbi:Recombination protein RecR [Aedoeadaptatus ivorii]|uniref:Recombination protein RecR n=1 Tax=Aedoeadaptatus ivorii TaxID=54006 RepID=A0A3S4YP59_9FIRM|nr:recombination mediator RecR [Peptoniphilus ivorii]MDQ0507628.1 recombination protein RecR [Peptoniphilus ivorii]VEJ35295.1 Recombination protein RecR [Peptoniphilus ivorii]